MMFKWHLNCNCREPLFEMINSLPTVYEAVKESYQVNIRGPQHALFFVRINISLIRRPILASSHQNKAILTASNGTGLAETRGRGRRQCWWRQRGSSYMYECAACKEMYSADDSVLRRQRRGQRRRSVLRRILAPPLQFPLPAPPCSATPVPALLEPSVGELDEVAHEACLGRGRGSGLPAGALRGKGQSSGCSGAGSLSPASWDGSGAQSAPTRGRRDL